MGDEYPVIAATDKAGEVLYGKTELTMKSVKPKAAVPKKPKKTKSEAREYGIVDAGLFAGLKALRKKIAESRGVPPYVVFADTALVDMCRRRPTTPDEFLAVSGVGNAKLELYGRQFMEVIKQYPDSGNRPELDERAVTYDEEADRDGGIDRIGYFPWTDEEVSRLKSELEAGYRIRQIAVIHKRTTGAIRHRIKKEGFEE